MTDRQRLGSSLELRISRHDVELFPHKEDDVVVLFLEDRVDVVDVAREAVPEPAQLYRVFSEKYVSKILFLLCKSLNIPLPSLIC